VFVLTKKKNLGKIEVVFLSVTKALEILKQCLPKNTNRTLKSRKNLREIEMCCKASSSNKIESSG